MHQVVGRPDLSSWLARQSWGLALGNINLFLRIHAHVHSCIHVTDFCLVDFFPGKTFSRSMKEGENRGGKTHTHIYIYACVCLLHVYMCACIHVFVSIQCAPWWLMYTSDLCMYTCISLACMHVCVYMSWCPFTVFYIVAVWTLPIRVCMYLCMYVKPLACVHVWIYACFIIICADDEAIGVYIHVSIHMNQCHD